MNKAQFIKLRKEYRATFQEIVKNFESSVVEWKRANVHMTTWIPYFEEVDIQEISHRPNRVGWVDDGYFLHGFDVDDRLIMIKEEGYYPQVIYFLYQNGIIDQITHIHCVNRPGQLTDPPTIWLSRYILTDGIAMTTQRLEWNDYDRFDWEIEPGKSTIFKKTRDRKLLIEVSSDNHIERTYFEGAVDPLTGEIEHYYIRSSNLTLDESGKRLEEFLIESIPETLAQVETNEQICLMILTYFDDEDQLMDIRLLTESGRKKLFADYDSSVMWSPDDVDSHSPVEDELSYCLPEKRLQLKKLHDDYINKCHLLHQEKSGEKSREPLRNVARNLNDYPWENQFQLTENFVVVALDNHGEQEYEDLKASIPPNKYKKLVKLGWIDDSQDDNAYHESP